MKRCYFISNSLDNLDQIEQALKNNGVTNPLIHILSNRNADVDKNGLESANPFIRKDVIHLTIIGAVIGIILSSLIIGTAYHTKIVDLAGWPPFIFLAIVVLGFCTWEGGFIGIQRPHPILRKLQPVLNKGKHVLFVDIEPQQRSQLKSVINKYDQLEPIGSSAAPPAWFIGAQDDWAELRHWAT